MQNKSENETVDLVKAMMALLILAIHTPLLGRWTHILMPVCRLGVPFFFVVGSYFFFNKVKKVEEEEKLGILKNYILRNIKLYSFWFIVSFPLCAEERYSSCFADGLLNGIWLMLKKCLFGSTWMASWYIAATIIGTTIIYTLSKKIKNNVLLFFSAIIYLICCFASNYWGIFSAENLVVKIINGYTQYLGSNIFCSFPVSLFWISLGKKLADEGAKKINIRYFVIAFTLLVVESIVVILLGVQYMTDCYILLIPTVFLGVSYVLTTDIKVTYSRYLRAFSVVVFCSQGIFITIFNKVFMHLGIIENVKIDILKYCLIVICCIMVTGIILKMEKNRFLHFLRYAH